MSDRVLRRRSVNVSFAGDDDVLQHIVDANNKKGPASRRRKSVPLVQVRKIEEETYSSDEEDENIPIKHSAALEDEDHLAGDDVFGFRTPKKSGQMAQVASISRTPKSILKTPVVKDSTPRKSVNFTPSKEKTQTPSKEGTQTPTRRSSRQRKPGATTPYRLHKRHGAGESDSSDSMDSSDSDSDVSEDKISSIGTPAKSTPSTPSTQKRRSTRKMEDVDMKSNVEEYFDIHGGDAGPTSDATLSSLDLPRMDHKSLTELLKHLPSSHQSECTSLYEDARAMFKQWMYQMCNGFNILLYGYGSKRLVIEEFRSTILKGFTQVVVNGYFPSLTIKHILSSITDEVLNYPGSFKNPLDQLEYIKSEFEKSGHDFYLIIHNIDGGMLRNEKTQNILSLLSQIPGFHLLASVDHINSSLIWDQTKCSRYKWLWYDCTTYASYTEETSYENSLLVQQSGALALSSLQHVMKSLTPNAKGIFLLLAKYQMENKDNATYFGMSLQDLYQRCRESFLVNSDLTLQAQLTEFRDHKMIKSKKSFDGVEHLHIPIDEATLKEFIDEHDN